VFQNWWANLFFGPDDTFKKLPRVISNQQCEPEMDYDKAPKHPPTHTVFIAIKHIQIHVYILKCSRHKSWLGPSFCSWDHIRVGKFICEHVGEVMH
jgi:hypothetical protein